MILVKLSLNLLTPLQETNNFIFLTVKASPTSRYHVIGVYLLRIGLGSRTLLPLAGRIFANSTPDIWPLTISTDVRCFRSVPLNSLGNYTPHVISYDCKKSL
jgi:hypothetical protein